MKATTKLIYIERIQQVLHHLETHLDRDLPLEALAELACFSPFHFHRIFRGVVGEGVKEITRRLRLERAAHFLRTTDQAVIDIALAAGYECHESFCRAFRIQYGASPSEFRAEPFRTHFAYAPSRIHYLPGEQFSGFVPLTANGERIMNARIEYVAPLRVAYVRHTGPYEQCHTAWEQLCRLAGQRGLLQSAPRFFGICHDDPDMTPPDRIRYDACVLAENFPGDDALPVQYTNAGEYAIATHQGPLEHLKDTYSAMCGRWIIDQGREPDAQPSLECYLNDPNVVAPEEIAVDVYVPLKPIAA